VPAEIQVAEPGKLLSRLVDAVAAGQASAATALADAVAGRALVQQSEHVLVPAAGIGVDAADELILPWLRRGFLPFRVKQHAYSALQLQLLTVLLRKISDVEALRCVPHWVVGDAVLTLHLAAAIDLRQVLEASPNGSVDVHAACLGSLERFVGYDEELRAALREAGLPGVRPFPVRERYRRARSGLRGLLGRIDLPEELPRYAAAGPVTLFCDPKPANFLLPDIIDRQGWPGAADWPVRIDLDLMSYECPVSLQIILALFAHPVVFHSPGDLAARFDEHVRLAYASAARFGIGRQEIDVMLLYHLLRNFVSAATHGDAQEAAKAMAFRSLLRCAAEQLPSIPASPDTVRRLNCADQAS
jgi:hypothetical protein